MAGDSELHWVELTVEQWAAYLAAYLAGLWAQHLVAWLVAHLAES